MGKRYTESSIPVGVLAMIIGIACLDMVTKRQSSYKDNATLWDGAGGL
jgi:hypothetical protein